MFSVQLAALARGENERNLMMYVPASAHVHDNDDDGFSTLMAVPHPNQTGLSNSFLPSTRTFLRSSSELPGVEDSHNTDEADDDNSNDNRGQFDQEDNKELDFDTDEAI